MPITLSASNAIVSIQASLNDLDIFVYDVIAGRPPLNHLYHYCGPGRASPIDFDTYTNFFHCSSCSWIAAYADLKDEYIVRGTLPPLGVRLNSPGSDISWTSEASSKKALVCECGSDSLRSPKHDHYCPKYVKI